MNEQGYKLNRSSALLLETAVRSGITSPAELANILGNAHVETAGYSTMHEDMRYRSVRSVLSAVSSADDRFSLQQIEAAVEGRDPREIAKILYEGRRDLGNTEPGDGWRFHGRGYFQYTGRENYTIYGEKFGVDLVRNPDIAAEPKMAAMLAIAYWKDKVPERRREDVDAAARVINGGDNGMEMRIGASREWEKVLSPELIEAFRSGELTHTDYPEASVRKGGRSNPAGEEQKATFPPPVVGPSHGDHPLLQRIREGVSGLDRQAGKAWDDDSERLSAALLVQAREKGFCDRDELQVAFNRPGGSLGSSEVVHMVRGGMGASADPFLNRVHVLTEQALSTPAEDSYRQAESVARTHTEAQQVARQEAQQRQPDHVMRS